MTQRIEGKVEENIFMPGQTDGIITQTERHPSLLVIIY